MKSYSYRLAIMMAALFFAAGNLIAQKPVVKKTTTASSAAPVKIAAKTVPSAATSSSNAKVYPNGIKLKIKGLEIKEAFLVFDDESKVPADNKVDLSQRVTLRIVLTKGFKEVEGKVFPGGTERIVLSNGDTILNSEDLFTAYDSTGVNPQDAKYISLKAVITEIRDKKNYVNVFFRVWDKKTVANEITGSYKLYIK
ncbi:hypothetical protein [Ferruginibacter sp. SUN106]|uniref:hypothetical protein n=1 Tax=Ferruginibacter sp. SUN106 TaxID=2978348 RepID=UPI003D363552